MTYILSYVALVAIVEVYMWRKNVGVDKKNVATLLGFLGFIIVVGAQQ